MGSCFLLPCDSGPAHFCLTCMHACLCLYSHPTFGDEGVGRRHCATPATTHLHLHYLYAYHLPTTHHPTYYYSPASATTLLPFCHGLKHCTCFMHHPWLDGFGRAPSVLFCLSPSLPLLWCMLGGGGRCIAFRCGAPHLHTTPALALPSLPTASCLPTKQTAAWARHLRRFTTPLLPAPISLHCNASSYSTTWTWRAYEQDALNLLYLLEGVEGGLVAYLRHYPTDLLVSDGISGVALREFV